LLLQIQQCFDRHIQLLSLLQESPVLPPNLATHTHTHTRCYTCSTKLHTLVCLHKDKVSNSEMQRSCSDPVIRRHIFWFASCETKNGRMLTRRIPRSSNCDGKKPRTCSFRKETKCDLSFFHGV
jgi:hypothetical protein